jgi:hypothetical protein
VPARGGRRLGFSATHAASGAGAGPAQPHPLLASALLGLALHEVLLRLGTVLRVGHLFLVLIEHAAELRLLPAVVQSADLLFAHVLLLLAKLFARDVLRVRLEIPLEVSPLVVVSSHGDVSSAVGYVEAHASYPTAANRRRYDAAKTTL